MAAHNYTLDDIEKYLNGEFSETEMAKYQEVLNTNHEWRKEHDQYAELILAIASKEDAKLKSTIHNVINQNQSQPKTTNMENRKKTNFFPIAAAFLVLAAVAFWWTSKGETKVDTAQLFAQNYNPESSTINADINKLGTAGFSKTNPEDTTSIDITKEEILEKQIAEQRRKDTLILALKQFKKSDWKASRKTLAEYKDKFQDPVEDLITARYHYAKACMNMSDYAAAIQEYDIILAPDSNLPQPLRYEADFERALCYLQVDNNTAKDAFKKISLDLGHKYNDIASGMLSNL